MAQRVATSRVYENKPQAEQIAASHAAARAQTRLDAQTGQMLTKAHANYLQKFRNPLLRIAANFRRCSSSTPPTTRYSSPRCKPIANSSARPRCPAARRATSYDLRSAVHESLVNNAADSLLSGVTLKEKELQDKVIELRGELPEQLKSEDDRDPWSITFAKSRPDFDSHSPTIA